MILQVFVTLISTSLFTHIGMGEDDHELPIQAYLLDIFLWCFPMN